MTELKESMAIESVKSGEQKLVELHDITKRGNNLESECGEKDDSVEETNDYYGEEEFSKNHNYEEADPDSNPRIPREEPCIFLEEDNPYWIGIRDFFDIAPGFPVGQLTGRQGHMRTLNFVSPSVKKLTLSNQFSSWFVHVGVKVFGRMVATNVACKYYLVQDGLAIIYPYLRCRIITIPKCDYITLLTSHSPLLESFSFETRQKLQALDNGACVFVNKPTEGAVKILLISGWKDDAGCRTFLAAYQRAHYLRLGSSADATCQDELLASRAAVEAICDFSQALSTRKLCR